MQAQLTSGPVDQQLKTMAIPMAWALLAMMSFGVADTFFVAQLGNAQLAAMSFTFPVEMLFTSLAIGAGAGVSSSLARLIGAGDSLAAKRIITDGTVLATLLAIVLGIISYNMIDRIFLTLGADEQLLPYIHQYMDIWHWCIPAAVASQVAMASLRAMGLSRMQGWIMACMSLLNIIIDPLLIFGLAGFPRLELQGAAIATVSIRWLGLMCAMYLIAVRLNMLASPIAKWSLILASWRKVIHVGLPAIATNMIIPLSSSVVVAMVATYGSDAVAGLGVASRIEPLALIAFYALSAVIGPFFGQNRGAMQFDRLNEAQRVCRRFCLSLGLVLAVILFFAGKTIASWFSDSAQVQTIAGSYLAIVPISYGAYGLVMSVNASFNGLGLPLPALLISSCRVLLLFIPLALVGQYFWGITGLFAAAAVCNIVLGIWGNLWLRRRIRSLSIENNAAIEAKCER